jgi:hypothetical protein
LTIFLLRLLRSKPLKIFKSSSKPYKCFENSNKTVNNFVIIISSFLRPANFPIINPQFPLYEDESDRNLRTIVETSDENEDVQQRATARLNDDLKPYQTMRLTKQIPNISQ